MSKMKTGNEKWDLAMKKQPDEELLVRFNLIKSVIQLLKSDEEMVIDLRQPDALEIYKKQLMAVKGELKRRGVLPKISIGLQSAKLTQKVPKY